MEFKIWSKTFLGSFSSLEKIIAAIDKIVLSTGLNLSHETYSATQKILELTERKITLINLKRLIETTLNKLPQEYARLLVLKYVDRVKSDEMAKILGISCRTFFRKSHLALKSFELVLKKEANQSQKLFSKLKKEHWLIDLYNRILLQEEQNEQSLARKKKEENISQKKIVNLAYSNYKRVEGPSLYL